MAFKRKNQPIFKIKLWTTKRQKFTVNFQKKKINVLNLDMDFSCLGYGYQEAPIEQRTRENFLIYLNTLKNDGAHSKYLNLKKNKKSKVKKIFQDFLKSQVQLSKSLIPSAVN